MTFLFDTHVIQSYIYALHTNKLYVFIILTTLFLVSVQVPVSVCFCIGLKRRLLVRGGSKISSQRGAHLIKLRRVEGGAKIFGVFRVKHHDFTPKNYIFSNCGGRCEHFLGISCEKSRFYAKKSYFFQFQGGGRAPGAPPAGSAPACVERIK